MEIDGVWLASEERSIVRWEQSSGACSEEIVATIRIHRLLAQ